MPNDLGPDITFLLQRWRCGDDGAFEAVVEHTYRRLLSLAAGVIAQAGLSTEPAALVNDAYLRLRAASNVAWQDREHFFSVAANLFRRILVDRSRERTALKRDGSQRRIPLSEDLLWIELDSHQVLDLDRALDELEVLDSDLARLVELRYLIGCTIPEMSELRAISGATVERRLRFARAWLFERLHGDNLL